tara:strand:- start:11536 stop:13065 length:1530 start_codon:yes stop_codon:yes gene_type:complete
MASKSVRTVTQKGAGNAVERNRQKLISAAKNSSDTKVLKSGAVVTYTGKCTGRSPGAKYIALDNLTADYIDWKNNQKCSESEFLSWLDRVDEYESTLKEIQCQTLYAGRDERHQIELSVRTSKAWQALFANNMFVRSRKAYDSALDKWTIHCHPDMHDVPKVLISFVWKKIIITGTHYAGEIKKSVFTVLNYILTAEDILPMHCSVNTDRNGKNSAIFFGLSGTGKTTLSADSDRILVGDDEHGWSGRGLFNFEGGCYAKVINLGKDTEPEIWDAVQAPGAVLENVVVTDEGIPMFDAKDHTENTRGSYPIFHIPNASETGLCDHPDNIIFLTCDAFGVLPPVAKLSTEEAVQHFLMGYTAKVAGTEAGVTEPVATFSHCFGAPFMPRPPEAYADLLREKIEKHSPTCWLVSTGWSGGEYGVGERMPIAVSRAVVNLIMSGELSGCEFYTHEHTGLSIPKSTSDENLNKYLAPEHSWNTLNAYSEAAKKLMKMWANRLDEMEIESESKQ